MFEVLYLYYSSKKLNVLHGSKKYGFRTDPFTPKAILFTP